MKNVTLIYGDGIGKEVMASAVEVIKQQAQKLILKKK